MSAFVADTHAVIWYILNQDALSSNARAAFDSATASGDPVYLSAISVVEIRYLVEKGKLTTVFFDRLDEALSSADAALVVIPVTLEIARTLNEISRTSIPEMPDRIIAATAFYLKLPLITRDRKIQGSVIKTVW
jgi:PIN domain nuclease of toxin-antitoxin system